ncbi:MAG: hypothetical protein Q7S13_03155 [Candidatus Omnitrophota bacterium]|nr:hypothetical protein [Candidatus Omnitrophota bacterium]
MMTFLKNINWTNWLNLLLVIITWGALYFQFLKSFDPSVHLNGRYKLSINPIGNRVYQTAITFGINFTNSGARIGFVDDVLLKLVSKSGEYKYIAAFNDLNERITLPVSDIPQLKELEYTPFAAFEMPAHTTVSKEIFFVPYDYTTPRLKPDEYDVFIYVRDSANKVFKKIGNTKIIIEQVDYESFPAVTTFNEAQTEYKKPFLLKFLTQSKILPEKDELIKKIK